jgi:hypothetical protein
MLWDSRTDRWLGVTRALQNQREAIIAKQFTMFGRCGVDGGAYASISLERFRKVRWIIEARKIGNFGDRNVGLLKQPACFLDANTQQVFFEGDAES